MNDVATEAPTEAPTEAVSVPTEPKPPTEAVSVPTEPKPPRRRGHYDTEKMLVNVTEAGAEDAAFSFSELPEAIQKHLGLHGMWMFMRAAETPTNGYANLVAGKLSEVREAKAAAEPELSPWKIAVAHTMVDMTKKREQPMSLDDAKLRVADLTRKQLADARRDPAVVKMFGKLNPGKEGEPSSPLAGLIG